MKKSKHAFAQWKAGGQPDYPQNGLYIAWKEAKHDLRQAQRCLAAQQRADTHSKIMAASTGDQKTFHKLIRCQRERPKSSTSVDICFKETEGDKITSQADQWAHYYEGLATPKESPNFNVAYKRICGPSTAVTMILNGKCQR